jgi:hypothetical protein
MVCKVTCRIPFFKETEYIFVLDALKKITPAAALFRAYGAEQRGHRLGQFLAFLAGHLHIDDDQNYMDIFRKDVLPA